MARRAGKYRAQLLLQASSHGPLQKLMSRWLAQLEAVPQAKKVRWSIDVDPQELF
jgi:primosomal protein N' (replication factor Y)